MNRDRWLRLFFNAVARWPREKQWVHGRGVPFSDLFLTMRLAGPGAVALYLASRAFFRRFIMDLSREAYPCYGKVGKTRWRTSPGDDKRNVAGKNMFDEIGNQLEPFEFAAFWCRGKPASNRPNNAEDAD